PLFRSLRRPAAALHLQHATAEPVRLDGAGAPRLAASPRSRLAGIDRVGAGEMAHPPFPPSPVPGRDINLTWRDRSATGAGLAQIEARFLGLFGAATEGFELLLGLGTGEQRQGLGIAHGAGKAFSLGEALLLPGRIQLRGAAVAIVGLARTTGQGDCQ